MARTQMDYMQVMPGEVDEVSGDTQGGPASSKLYISHFLSTWNSRGFEFGAILFLATIYPGNLLPMSVYALIRSFAAIILSPAIGSYIDRSNRLLVVRLSIVGQRVAVACSCVLFLSLLFYKNGLPRMVPEILFWSLAFLACVEKLCSIMNTIAVERDWVVVIAADNERLLQEMNSQMRRIDLFCKLVSPLATALLDGISHTIAISTTLGINLFSTIVEYLLIAWVYKRTSSLSKSHAMQSTAEHRMLEGQSSCAWLRQTVSALIEQAKSYTRSHAFLPSLSLSMLYLTVLSFSGQMITYLFTIEHPRLNSTHIGLLRTITTILEISATYVAPVLTNRLGAVRAGIWSLSWQFMTLSPGVAALWSFTLAPSASRTFLFIASVILSRVGLWSFDLTAQLLVQNSIDANHRGSFSATESSLQNFFELCSFAMTVVWSEPRDFIYPATVSLVAVYVAAAVYARFVRVERGHLLHLPQCCTSDAKYEAIETDDGGELSVLHSP